MFFGGAFAFLSSPFLFLLRFNPDTHMKLTRQMIDSGRSDNGGWSKEQLRMIGVSWPPKLGWPAKVTGTEITEETFQQFLKLKNRHKLSKRRSRSACRNDVASDINHHLWDQSAEQFANELYDNNSRNLS